MPIVQINPPNRPGGFGNWLRNLPGALLQPVQSITGAVLGSRTRSSGAQYLPTTLDTETGDVSIPLVLGGAGRGIAARARPLLDDIERALEQTWRTGEIAPGVPAAYSAVAGAILDARQRFGAPPTTTAETTSPWSQYEMASALIPPGGMAGFLQMTPASRLALTGGRSRGSRRSRSRRKASSRKRSANSRRASRTRKRSAASSKSSRTSKRFVKGSAAAKRYMARLRKMRKR